MSNTHCSTTPKPKRLGRKAAAILALAAGGVLAFGPVRRAAACWYDPIIFDPSALAEHVQQVVHVGQQISAAIQQVQNQLHDLAHLNRGVALNDRSIISGVRGQLDSSLYETPAPANQLNTRYPDDLRSATWQQYQSDQSTWTRNERQAMVENRQVENQVCRDMDPTRQQVQAIVEASNSAPGETSAIQAHNDLLAVASGELAKIQALKAARCRLKTEKLARRQSELSYAAAERDRARGEWENPAPPTGSVADPFQN